MKKIILFTLLLIIVTTTFSQQTNPVPELTKQDYLQRSKKQKTAAWILAGGGIGLVMIAIVTTTANDVYNAIGGNDNGLNAGAALFAIGGIAAVGSIPLFIASGKNKRKGMSLSFKNETAPQIQKNSFVYRSVPSVSLKIGL